MAVVLVRRSDDVSDVNSSIACMLPVQGFAVDHQRIVEHTPLSEPIDKITNRAVHSMNGRGKAAIRSSKRSCS